MPSPILISNQRPHFHSTFRAYCIRSLSVSSQSLLSTLRNFEASRFRVSPSADLAHPSFLPLARTRPQKQSVTMTTEQPQKQYMESNTEPPKDENAEKDAWSCAQCCSSCMDCLMMCFRF
ncbi:hypothetical protein CI238_07887 [Colletotrichum incanum]|uniref:Uncharacterized protein n=1 Tax=Colletotrichum incanum TaxID=1573173 RepID=A0A167E4I5_COLIC|nr:hypothetical protein CI238_07887 [Colletotrichum incanum]